MRIVIDSNVWISALVFGGKPRHIFELVIRNGWTIILSEDILVEIRRILKRKFVDFTDDFESFRAVMSPNTLLVKVDQPKTSICRDCDDNLIIDSAIISGAKYIVTGDKDLLTLVKYEHIVIFNPTDFITSIN